MWRNSTSSYEGKPHWIDGLQKYLDDLSKIFDAFPAKFSAQSRLVKPALAQYLAKVTEASNSKSKILSSGAHGIAEALSHVNIVEYNVQGILNEFVRILPNVMNQYREVVTNLTTTLGSDLVTEVNNALSDIESSFIQYTKKFNTGGVNGLKIKIDYEPVMESSRTLTQTISLKRGVSLRLDQLANPEVQDAMVVLNLVLEHVMLMTLGLNSCSEVILWEQNCKGIQSC